MIRIAPPEWRNVFQMKCKKLLTFANGYILNFCHCRRKTFWFNALGWKIRGWNVLQSTCSNLIENLSILGCYYKDWIIARFFFFFQLNVLLLGVALILDFCKNHWMILMIVWISVLTSLTESGSNFLQTSTVAIV